MKQPRPGELRELVLIRRRADIPMAGGGLAASFTGERYADAKVEPVGTAVYLSGIQSDDKITHRVFMRAEMGAGVDNDCEVVHESVVYRVRRRSDVGGARRFCVVEVEELGSESRYG
ncbi:head-tail adaptor protein [Achromobacter xylosoxidans]|uniref:head-tail adaptor protein n=1 Tax=Alcaligenes xylosoxydans xylosoxydans TaxID=85698 RepID=UPI001F132F5C|nr:head-tail adaptor protein [Achromobacter xylosoxidans]